MSTTRSVSHEVAAAHSPGRKPGECDRSTSKAAKRRQQPNHRASLSPLRGYRRLFHVFPGLTPRAMCCRRFATYAIATATLAAIRLVVLACISMSILCTVASAEDVAAGKDAGKAANARGIKVFEKQIAPILKRRCYQCHSHETGKAKGGLVLDSRHGWTKGGSEGPAIVPGKPSESLLIEAIRYEGYEMPPEKRLPASEIALLVKWVAMGARDPRESKAPKVNPEKLWALQPITKSSVPRVKDANWPQDDIDAFVLARLEEEGLSPASSADRYTLLRRVAFDRV